MPNKHGRSRRSFSLEFKQQAVDLVLKSGYSYAAASRDLPMQLAFEPAAGNLTLRVCTLAIMQV